MTKSLLVSALAIALLAGGCGDGRGDIDVQTTTSRAVDDLPAKGPALGTYARDWSTKTGGTELRTVGGQVIDRLEDGIQAYDARTGKPTWKYQEPDRDLNGYAETDGVVVVNTTNSGSREDNRHTAGLDASTGRILWETTDKWYLAYDDPSTSGGPTNVGTAGGGTVVIRPDDDDVRLGIDARTGDERWSVSADDISGDECHVRKLEKVSRADGPVVPVRLECEAPSGAPEMLGKSGGPEVPDEVIAAVDADSGEVRWRQDVETIGTDTFMRDGVTLIDYGDEGTAPHVIDRNGRRIFAGEEGSTCFGGGCTIALSGPYVVLTYRGAEAGERNSRPDRIAIIDTRSGTVRRLTDGKKHTTAGAWGSDDAGHSYRITGLWIDWGMGNMLPLVVERLDLATGKTRRAPIFEPGVRAGRVVFPRQVVSAAGDRLLLAEPGPTMKNRQYTLDAYQWTGGGEPYEFGGVRPEEWPDPCKLLAGVPLDPSDDPSTEGKITIGSLTIPRTMCRREMPEGYVRVVVNWVAAEPEQADALLAGRKPSVRGADEEESGDGQDASRHMYRVGRTIVTIDGYDVDDEVIETILRNVARSS